MAAMIFHTGCRALALGAFLIFIGATAAEAHPHVWVTIKSEAVYAPDGSLLAVRHNWTFDEMFSAFATQGLDKNKDGKLTRDELSELANVNVTSLKEFDYFTVAKNGTKPIAFEAPTDYWLDFADGQLTLHFTLPVKPGTAKGGVTLDVYDPTYFVAFEFAEGEEPVKLSGAPPACKLEIRRPGAAVSSSGLSESFFNSLKAGSDYGAQFANRIIVRCP
jgi:ABC-type uncharacterized transport system substrate-binding protein